MGAIPGVRGNVYHDRLFDASGTITAGGTAQLVLPEARIRSSLIIQNISSVNMFVETGAARATAALTNGVVASCAVTNAGFGYSVAPTIKFFGGCNGAVGSPVNTFTSLLQGTPDSVSPQKTATAHCVMTGSAPNMTVSSIVVDSGGSGYAYPPYVLLTNSNNDPFGCAVPSATSGIELLPQGSYTSNGSLCVTDQIAIYCATTNSAYTCKFSI